VRKKNFRLQVDGRCQLSFNHNFVLYCLNYTKLVQDDASKSALGIHVLNSLNFCLPKQRFVATKLNDGS
jgi:hypothetical protein